MPDLKLIRAITETDLPLELVDGKIFEQLRAKTHTSVGPRELKSSSGVLISESFARCQGVSFLNGREIGALAHNYSTDNPHDTLTRTQIGRGYQLEDPRVIFSNTNSVLAVHVYHRDRYEWPERMIESALKRIGIEKVVHIPIKPKESGKIFWRHMAQDVKDGSVYVFPTDFDVGIKYQPKI